ncbi:UDP-N-acetylmuramoyl-tripeptide--D-alanyl-D-alanine ligase [Thiohalocapsa marina]|uniref:UDP-N-acetylmuramoyl-tripeptide--D-alanyl-D- alanine ligase n=1 Tax=Thiohalocapsa marina TaxID=424902 RepID=UPI0036DE7B51
MLSLSESAAMIGGRLTGHDAVYDGVVTDSRGDCRGQLFVALRGERHDGHDHVARAQENGAVAALVEHPLQCDLPQCVVQDTRRGLGRLAAGWRERIPARVVAITGSNGKTTVKEMVAAILSRIGRTRATRGNLNNDIGMPLTLLSARDEDYLVLEMGANHPGEIGYLSAIAQPDAALITNAGRAHLEGFGSVEGVARAKGEIASGLRPDGTFVFPADAPWTALWLALADGRSSLTFGGGTDARIRADADSVRTQWDDDGFRTRFQADIDDEVVAVDLALAGRHNVRNALGAMAVARALGIPSRAMQEGLASLRPVSRRLQPRLCQTPAGTRLRIIDDSYNANPDSLGAAIDVLTDLCRSSTAPNARGLLAMGDFGELGPDSEALHRDMGAAARAAGVDALFAVGALAAAAAAGFGDGGRAFQDQAALVTALRAAAGPEDVLLVKGSRASGMDRVTDALCERETG